jgi:predicted amidohydrolase
VKVAAYQAPLLPGGSMRALDLMREQVRLCETAGVEIVCCPEAILGGLADDLSDPAMIAIASGGDELARLLAPLASTTVTTIVGFTEVDARGRLFNAAAVFHDGGVLGRYRKRHPGINRSIYVAGDAMPVFTVGHLTFGVIICNDSNYDEPMRVMASQGATAIFVPTNNGLPAAKGGPAIVVESRRVDRTHATTYRIDVIRSDVAGAIDGRVSYGSTAIVDRAGEVLAKAPPLTPALIVANIETRRLQRSWGTPAT